MTRWVERRRAPGALPRASSHVCPRSIDFQAELPRHPIGKLYKRLLKDRYWQGHKSCIL